MTLSETLREWWWAVRWVMKNPRQAWNLEDPLNDIVHAYPLEKVVGRLVSLVGLTILGIFTYFLIPGPINWLVIGIEAGIVILITILATQKMFIDWFDQHYEIREKQKEAEK